MDAKDILAASGINPASKVSENKSEDSSNGGIALGAESNDPLIDPTLPTPKIDSPESSEAVKIDTLDLHESDVLTPHEKSNLTSAAIPATHVKSTTLDFGNTSRVEFLREVKEVLKTKMDSQQLETALIEIAKITATYCILEK